MAGGPKATKPSLVSALVGASGAPVDFGLARRECGTAPGGATRPNRSATRTKAEAAADRKRAVHDLLKDEAWFADTDSPLLDDGLDDCPSPTLFLSDGSASLFGDRGINGTYDAADPVAAEGMGDVGDAAGSGGSDARPAAVQRASTLSSFDGSSGSLGTPRSGTGRSRVEGGMNLSPRGSFDRGAGKKPKGHSRQNGATHGREPESAMLKGLLNSADMEDRLATAQQGRMGGAHPNLRLMIPSPVVDNIQQLERPPSRQRNLPMHLNSDLSLELPSHDGQLSPDVERKWAHYASTPRPQSRHKSPPDAVFLDLPPEPLQGDRDPMPLPPEEQPPSPAIATGSDKGGPPVDALPPQPQLLSTPMTAASRPAAAARVQGGGGAGETGATPRGLGPPGGHASDADGAAHQLLPFPPHHSQPAASGGAGDDEGEPHGRHEGLAHGSAGAAKLSGGPMRQVGTASVDDFERLEMCEPTLHLPTNEGHGRGSTRASSASQQQPPRPSAAAHDLRRASSRPDTPTSYSRPASGPRAHSVAGSPRGNSAGFGSHAHARAHQLQVEAAAQAAAAANSPFPKVSTPQPSPHTPQPSPHAPRPSPRAPHPYPAPSPSPAVSAGALQRRGWQERHHCTPVATRPASRRRRHDAGRRRERGRAPAASCRCLALGERCLAQHVCRWRRPFLSRHDADRSGAQRARRGVHRRGRLTTVDERQ